MKLLTKNILKNIPNIGETAELNSENITVHLKLFNPVGHGTWYITEYNPITNEAFGFVLLDNPDFAELGYISITELENLKLPLNSKIERDIYFKPQNLKYIINSIKCGKYI